MTSICSAGGKIASTNHYILAQSVSKAMGRELELGVSKGSLCWHETLRELKLNGGISLVKKHEKILWCKFSKVATVGSVTSGAWTYVFFKPACALWSLRYNTLERREQQWYLECGEMLSKSYASQTEENRKKLLVILISICYLGGQGLALRGRCKTKLMMIQPWEMRFILISCSYLDYVLKVVQAFLNG